MRTTEEKNNYMVRYKIKHFDGIPGNVFLKRDQTTQQPGEIVDKYNFIILTKITVR